MDQLAEETDVNAELAQTVRSEVEKYVGQSDTSHLYPVFDSENHQYCVITVRHHPTRLAPRVVVMARLIGNKIIIEEDTTDKPLVDALMVNAHVPREQIILAYAGEKLPETNVEE